jgi:hypothetical protein
MVVSYDALMSLRCLFDLHRPLLNSIMQRPAGYAALCEGCTLPIERSEDGRWTPCKPLAQRD